MPLYSSWTGVWWWVADGSCHFLAPPDADGYTYPQYSSADGSVVVGYAHNASNAMTSARWDWGVLTALPSLGAGAVGTYDALVDCSATADLIAGQKGYWTEGGATTNVLAQPPGFVSYSAARCSYDGTTIIGQCFNNSTPTLGGGCYWINNVPTPLGSIPPYQAGPGCSDCSDDGTTQFGQMVMPVGFNYRPTFWRGGVAYPLPLPPFFSSDGVNFGVTACSGDGTQAYSGYGFITSSGSPTQVYISWWDNFTQDNGDGTFGVRHDRDFALSPGGGSADNQVAWSKANNIAVGSTYNGVNTHGVRWVGATRSEFPTPVAGSDYLSVDVSYDGSVTTGYYIDVDNFRHAVVWDATLGIHVMDIPPGFNDAVPYGISANGMVVYGIVNYVPPPPGPEGQLKQVLLYPMDAEDR